MAEYAPAWCRNRDCTARCPLVSVVLARHLGVEHYQVLNIGFEQCTRAQMIYIAVMEMAQEYRVR